MLRNDLQSIVVEQQYQRRLAASQDHLITVMENLQSQLEPEMKDWMPTGGSGTSSFERDIPITDLRSLVTRSRHVYYREPHGRVVMRDLVKFVIGGGTVVDFREKNEENLKDIISWWRKFCKKNSWVRRQREIITRAFRDGNVLIRRIDQPMLDEPPLIRFLEPDQLDDTIEHPSGIEYDENDAETPVAYFIRWKKTNQTERILAEQILHIKIDVDENVPLGRPIIESVLQYLGKYNKWIDARMALNMVRASVALVKQVAGSPNDLSRLRANQSAQQRNRANETDRAKMLRPGTIISGTPGVEYKMLSPNLDARDAAEDGATLLRGVAAGAGFPDVFVTANYANSNYACHANGTEILTWGGWKQFANISEGDQLATRHPVTGALEYQTPTAVQQYPYKGEMFGYGGRRLKFSITPNHEMLVADYYQGKENKNVAKTNGLPPSAYKKIAVSQLNQKAKYLTPTQVHWTGAEKAVFYLPDNLPVGMDSWLEFLGYVITDGCVTESFPGMMLYQELGEKAESMERCLKNLPFKYTRRAHRRAHAKHKDMDVFYISGRPIKEFVCSLIGTPEGSKSWQKHLPDFIWHLHVGHLKKLLDALILGDGTIPKEKYNWKTQRVFRTSSPQLADDVQRLAITLGHAASLASPKESGGRFGTRKIYWVGITDGYPKSMKPKLLERKYYEGNVWCATVPNGSLITRYEGRCSIFGNSTVVSQNTGIREAEDWELFFGEHISTIVYWVLVDGIHKEQIPSGAEIDHEINFPPLIRRDMSAESVAYKTMHEDGVISKRSWALRMGFNPDEEERLIQEEGGPPQVKPTRSPTPAVAKDPSQRKPRQNVDTNT